MGERKKLLLLLLGTLFSITIIFISYLNTTKEASNVLAVSHKDEVDINKEEVKYKKEYDTNQKIAFLTFDDGPSKNTEKILEILKKENIKGTFFVNGYESEFAIKMYREIVANGNAIANHSYSHDYESLYKSKEAFFNDVEKLNDLIYKETGVRPDIIRFPGGSNNHVNRKYSGSKDNSFMENLSAEAINRGYEYFDWNVDSKDASKKKQDVNKIINTTLNEVNGQKYPIILFHDAEVKTTTVEALPKIIKKLKEEGYIFETLSKDIPVKCKFLEGKYNLRKEIK